MLKGFVSGAEKDIVRIPMKGKNLFDGEYKRAILSVTGSSAVYNTGSSGRVAIIPCNPSTRYTVKKHGDSNRFAIAESETSPSNGDTVPIIVNNAGISERTFTTAANTHYILVYVSTSSEQAEPPLMLNAGSTPLPYEPYGYQEGWEVRDNQDRLIWGREDELQTATGTLPFKGYGLPVKVKSLLGNAVQNGTPTPDNPVMPEFVGVRTANLAYGRIEGVNVAAGGMIARAAGYDVAIARVENGVVYTANSYVLAFYTTEPVLGSASYNNSRIVAAEGTLTTFTAPITGYVAFRIASGEPAMLNSGSTALPYEPFGWAEKITCAGQTTPVYLGQTQTVRRVRKSVLTGEETWLSSGMYKGAVYAYHSQFPGIKPLTPIFCTHLVYAYGSSYVQGTCKNDSNSVGLWVFDTVISPTGFKEYLAQQYAAGNPVTLWYVLAEPGTGIVNEPLAKIGDYSDELNDTVAALPEIPTTTGQNTLTVDTTLAPSSLTIKGHVKQSS